MLEKRHVWWVLTSVNSLFACVGHAAPSVPFELYDGHVILIRVPAIGIAEPLNVMIDTGSTHSFLNRRAVKRIKASVLKSRVSVLAFGAESSAERVIVRGLRLGGRAITVACYTADLPWRKVDLLLGLDVLSLSNFTIDFDKNEIEFESNQRLADGISFELEKLVLITARAGAETYRLSIDTGAPFTCLHADRVGNPIKWLSSRSRVMRRFGGTSDLRMILLPTLQLGKSRWRNLPAGLIRDTSADQRRDGVIGLASLGMARVHFDFQERRLSWDHEPANTLVTAYPGLE